MMNVIKKVGFALQWLWLPLLSYAFGLTLYALMISKGIDNLDWPLWRIFLVIALIFLMIMGKKLSSSCRVSSIFAALGAALPWGCLAVVWLIKLYFDWAFSWPPVDWVYHAFLATYALPFFVAVAAFTSDPMQN